MLKSTIIEKNHNLSSKNKEAVSKVVIANVVKQSPKSLVEIASRSPLAMTYSGF